MIKKRVVAPAFEPVTLAEAKAQCRVDLADDDALITDLIVAARQYVEAETGLALITQTWEVYADYFGWVLELSPAPVASVVSASYVDVNGVVKTLQPSDYRLDSVSEPARLVSAYGQSWPPTLGVIHAVTIKITAGWGAAPDVPATLRQSMLLLISHWYENRESVSPTSLTEIPFGVAALLGQHKVHEL